MNNEIFEYLSSRSGDAKTTENCRIKEIAHELCRRCRLYEKKSADSFNDVMTRLEQRVSEEYAKEKYGEKWDDAAKNLASSLELDKNNALTYVQVIDAPNKSKDQLYVLLNYWFSATFNDANSVIQLNDKELGTIIAQGFVEGIAQHTGGMNSYNVHLKPVIKCDIKDNKIILYIYNRCSNFRLICRIFHSIINS